MAQPLPADEILQELRDLRKDIERLLDRLPGKRVRPSEARTAARYRRQIEAIGHAIAAIQEQAHARSVALSLPA